MTSTRPSPNFLLLTAGTSLAATSLASLNLSLSFLMTPRILELPTPLMLQQWTASYHRTSKLFPLGMIACGASYAYLARTTTSNCRGHLLGTAAALCFSIVPWTRIFMLKRLNAKILALWEKYQDRVAAFEGTPDAGAGVEEEAAFTAEEEESAKWLVDRWGMFNLGRGIAVGLAGAIGVLTLMH